MGKNRKGKSRFANAKNVNDVLDEQMYDANPEDGSYNRRSRVEKNYSLKNRNHGKINRNQKRNRQINATKQKNYIQKGRLFADLDDPENYGTTSSGADLRSYIDTKKVSLKLRGVRGGHKGLFDLPKTIMRTFVMYFMILHSRIFTVHQVVGLKSP